MLLLPRPVRLTLVAVALLLAAPRHARAEAEEQRAVKLNNLAVMAAQQGRFDDAVNALREAVKLNPKDPAVRKNLSGILTDWATKVSRAGQVDKAHQLLLEAVEHEPQNGPAYAMLGDLAYFKRGDFTQAIMYWKKAAAADLSAADRKTIADRITQAQRDQIIEREYASSQTEHFDIRMQTDSGVSLETLGPLLEKVYAVLAVSLGAGPPRVSVIIYTEQDLRRAYNQRDWAIGFYDGRLRMRADEVNTAWAQAFISHELTHAFLHFRYGELPIWVQEGLAQLEEGEWPQAEEERAMEERVTSGADWVPLKWLDRHFTHPSNREDINRAYKQAKVVAVRLAKKHGAPAVQTFLERLAAGDAADAAYDKAFAPDRWVQTDRPFD